MKSNDKLPPHSDEAEAGLLGCVLLAGSQGELDRAGEILAAVAEAGPLELFWDLRHRKIAEVLLNLRAEGLAAGDPVTLGQRIRDSRLEQQVGGLGYVSGLADRVATVTMWPEYLKVVVNKYVARRLLQLQERWRGIVEGAAEITESLAAQVQREVEEWQALAGRGLQRAPKDVARITDMAERVWRLWVRQEKEEPGLELPFEFPLRVRPHEVTLLAGDNGAGKSSMLSQVALVLARQDWRIFMVSLEVPPEVTYWIMLRQLFGARGPSAPDESGRLKEFARAVNWLKDRVLIYDFTGITQWRGLLDVFWWLRRHERLDCFVVDSVMRLGIEDDNYTEQGLAAARFADFAVRTGAHVMLVIHENKGDGSVKQKIRGSKQWSDNAHNVCSLVRNERKAEKRAEVEAQVKSGEITEEEARQVLQGEKFAREWDAKFRLHKQRWPGSRQNGSRHLYFYYPALQFLTHWDDPPFRYLPDEA